MARDPLAHDASRGVDALEQLRALLAPGLDWAHGLIFGAAADAGAAVELRFGQIDWQVD
jgi:hypothetical protein